MKATPNSNPTEVPRLTGPVPEDISKRVGEEVLTRNFEPGIWAQALAGVSGRRDEALAAYSRLRITQLMAQRERVLTRACSMESRRLHSCLGVTTVKELLQGMSKVGAVNLPKPRLPMGWLMVMAIGLGGSLAALVHLLADSVPPHAASWLPLTALGAGLLLVTLGGLLTRLLPDQVLRWVWGEGMVASCGLVCMASLLLGTKLLISHPRIEAEPPSASAAAVAPLTAEVRVPEPVLPESVTPRETAGLLSPYFAGDPGHSMADR